MVYTFNSGVKNLGSKTLTKASSLALPLLALVFLLIAAFSFSTHQKNGQRPNISVKKQTYSAAAGSSSGSSHTSGAPLTTTPAASAASANPQQSLSAQPFLGSSASPTTSLTLVGGMGGGDPTTLSSTPTLSSPTVVCTDLLTVSQICTACTPPLTLQPGQKALLSADGTCVAAN